MVGGGGRFGGVWTTGIAKNEKHQLFVIMRTARWIYVLLGSCLFLAVLPMGMEACSTCFGRSDSDMARGMNMGIFTLLSVLAFVLSILVAFFVFIGVRSSRSGELEPELDVEDESRDERS
jgi:hypothetical protein